MDFFDDAINVALNLTNFLLLFHLNLLRVKLKIVFIF